MSNFEELTLADRADCCNAQAFVQVQVGETILRFCGHHFGRHETTIFAAGYPTLDSRDQINTNPSLSASV